MGSAVIGASLYSAPLDAAAPAAATCQAVVGGNTLSRLDQPLGTGLYEDYMLHSFYESLALIAMQNDRMAEADADLYAQALGLAAHVEGHSEGLTDMDPDGHFAELAGRVRDFQTDLARIRASGEILKSKIEDHVTDVFGLHTQDVASGMDQLQLVKVKTQRSKLWTLEWVAELSVKLNGEVPELFAGSWMGGPRLVNDADTATMIDLVAPEIASWLAEQPVFTGPELKFVSDLAEGREVAGMKRGADAARAAIGRSTRRDELQNGLDLVAALQERIDLTEELRVVAGSYVFAEGGNMQLLQQMRTWHGAMVDAAADDALKRTTAAEFLRWLKLPNLPGPAVDLDESTVEGLDEEIVLLQDQMRTATDEQTEQDELLHSEIFTAVRQHYAQYLLSLESSGGLLPDGRAPRDVDHGMENFEGSLPGYFEYNHDFSLTHGAWEPERVTSLAVECFELDGIFGDWQNEDWNANQEGFVADLQAEIIGILYNHETQQAKVMEQMRELRLFKDDLRVEVAKLNAYPWMHNYGNVFAVRGL